MKSDGGNNSLGSIASISKAREMGEKETRARTGKKKKENLASRARWPKGNQVETEG